MKNECKILVGRAEDKRSLGRIKQGARTILELGNKE
jgi:hypothetical protein